VQEVNKTSPHLVTVLEVKGYGFSDFTISEGFSSLYIFKWLRVLVRHLILAPF